MANYHVLKDSGKGWRVKREGAGKISSIHRTQKQAEQFAKRYSSNSGGGEVRIHSVKGHIRDSDTVKPGNDPCPPKDKKH